MSKKDNLLKFWESLESNQQTIEVMKPYRPQSKSLKIKSKSQNDLLSPRPSIVPSKAQLQGRRGGTGSMDTNTTTQVYDQGSDEICVTEMEKTEVGSLPDIPRHEILTHTTKSRVRRKRTHPTRKKSDQVPCVQVITSMDEQINPYQTPPAAANEFSNFKHSPTSARFLDKSPLPPPELDASSPKPATSLSKPSSAFIMFSKPQESKSSKKDLPAVPKRNLIPSSPKVSPRHRLETEGPGKKPVCGQLIPGEVKNPFHDDSLPKTPSRSPITSAKANFYEQMSRSLKSVSTSKIDITDRRVSLKAVSTPSKSLQAGITPLTPEPASLQPITSPRIARLTANFQSVTSSPASKTAVVKALDLEAVSRTKLSGTSVSVNSAALPSGLDLGKAVITELKTEVVSSSTLTCTPPQVSACVQAGRMKNINMEPELLVEEEVSHRNSTWNENQDFNVFVNEINQKVEILESAVTEEKLARIKLEKEVAELRLVVSKLSLLS